MKIGINRTDSWFMWALRVLLTVLIIFVGWMTVDVAYDPKFQGYPWGWALAMLAFMIAARFCWALDGPTDLDEKYDF